MIKKACVSKECLGRREHTAAARRASSFGQGVYARPTCTCLGGLRAVLAVCDAQSAKRSADARDSGRREAGLEDEGSEFYVRECACASHDRYAPVVLFGAQDLLEVCHGVSF